LKCGVAGILSFCFCLALLVGENQGTVDFLSVSRGSCNRAAVGAATENQECWQSYRELCVPSWVCCIDLFMTSLSFI
jgi:hypothetical protein